MSLILSERHSGTGGMTGQWLIRADKWDQTSQLYYLVIVCSIGSAIQGWGE